ncbi:major facilitator superfamily domain-containing protein [Cladochytrium replicatum]|nr:major facilitator superfamily domain-containing protein [Cladochytrium replicatum]
MSAIKNAIVHHFSSTKYERSEAQLERERWLIPNLVPFSRWYLLPAAVLIQLCVGSLYAFSGYYLSIEAAIFGANGAIDRGQASITFYIAVAVFGSTAAILGPWMERNGPFRGTLLGASLFYLGNLLAALGVYVQQIWVVWIGYGVVGGMGLGIGYISPVSPLQKWFPEIRGVAAGLAVCGFGGGSIIAPYSQLALIGANYAKAAPNDANLGVPLTFVILGSIYFVVMILAGLVLRMPPPGYEVKGITIETIRGAENMSATTLTNGVVDNMQTIKIEDNKDMRLVPNGVQVEQGSPKNAFSMTLLESLGSREFGLMYAMLFCAQLTGLLIISKVQSICINQLKQTPAMAATYNSALGVMNLAGRLILPTISDFVGRKPLFMVSLAVQAVLVGCLPIAIHAVSVPGVLTIFFIIAMFYGAGFGIIPAFLADQFGSKNVGATHGVILTAWSLAGVGGGLVFNSIVTMRTNDAKALAAGDTSLLSGYLLYIYDTNLIWVLIIVLVGFVITFWIPVNLRDRRLPKREGEMLRFRSVGGHLVRMVKMSKEEEEREWEEYCSGINGGRST